jgi:hypothetical protein
MFSQDPPVWREASGNRFYDDFELDFGGILEAKLALIFSFGRPGGASGSPFLRSYGNQRKPAANYIESEGQAYVKD